MKEELKSILQTFKMSTSSLLRHMNESLHKVVAAPAIRRKQLNNEQEEVNEANENHDVAKIPLMICPRTLAILWTEFKFGIGGNKPAKYFNVRDRGMVKFAYCLRKLLAISTENNLAWA